MQARPSARSQISLSAEAQIADVRGRAGGAPNLRLNTWLFIGLILAGQVVLIAGLLWQRARRQMAEARLGQSERRYRQVANAALVGVWECNLKTGATYVDPQLNHLLGYEEQKVGDHLEAWRPLVHADDREAVEKLARMAMSGALPVFELKLRMLHREGNVRWFLARGQIAERNGDKAVQISGTYTDVTQHNLEQHSLRKSEARAHALAGKLISAQEAERTRIARELHDNASQRIAMLSIGLGMVMRDLAGTSTSQLRTELRRLQDHATALGDQIRHFSHELHPGVLQRAGLIAALSEHCAEVAEQHGLYVDFHSSELGTISTDAALCLYRVAQETLHNIAKHAHATRVDVDLKRGHGGLELSISDDGRGFDPAKLPMASGLGLISLEERVRLLDGSLTIDADVDKGTRVRVQLPEEGEGHAAHPIAAR